MDVKAELRGIFTALKKNLPGSEPRLLKLLHEREWEIRLEVVKAIRQNAFMPFARRLADRLGEEDNAHVRSSLIAACGDLRSPETLEALLMLASKDRATRTEERGQILYALKNHDASERARDYFLSVFEAELPEPSLPFDNRKEERVLAAWGVMKLGVSDVHDEAHAFLMSMLEDHPQDVYDAIGDVKATDPGVSRRARQALEDLGLMPKRSRMPPPPTPGSSPRAH